LFVDSNVLINNTDDKKKEQTMLRLILFRHAKADRPEGVADHERPLAPRGRRQSEAMGKYMVAHGLVPDLAIVSTSRRTQETWKIALPAFKGPIPQTDERRIYESSADNLLEVIRETADDKRIVVLVGHNPGMAQVAERLIGTGHPRAVARIEREYPTGALAVIDFKSPNWAAVSERSGYLERFETPATVSE
jgi:phosphohistidine phosphatase